MEFFENVYQNLFDALVLSMQKKNIFATVLSAKTPSLFLKVLNVKLNGPGPIYILSGQ